MTTPAARSDLTLAGCGGTYRAVNDTSLGFPPERTALLVIDPVNDFLSEGGAGSELTKGTVKRNNVVENLARVIQGVRGAGIPVLFGPMAYTEPIRSPVYQPFASGSDSEDPALCVGERAPPAPASRCSR